MDLFVANHIYKTYANHRALYDVSISVPEGCIFGLLGPNGAGKTSLIRIINQITAPDSGEIFFMGKKLHQQDVQRIGYLPEERGLYKKMKVGEQALYLAQLKGLSKHEALKRLKYWFEKFEILSWWNKKVEELSKGMQQKVQFIVTILHNPKLLIFDEPFSGFDPINAQLLKDEILELRKNGATIIFSTHNMASVEELCDRIALINKSKKILDGDIRDIKNSYKQNIYSFVCSYKEDIEFTLRNKFELLNWEIENRQIHFIVKAEEEINSNQLIEKILPYATVLSFNEILPSMNDIFISKVKETNPN